MAPSISVFLKAENEEGGEEKERKIVHLEQKEGGLYTTGLEK